MGVYEVTLLSVWLCFTLIVVRQRLGKHAPAATITHTTIEELLDAVFSLRSVSYQILNMATASSG
jgi:hypothetical protein